MNIALILAGGTGTRLRNDIPKQYIKVGGKPVISYCVETLTSHEMIDYIVIAADNEWQNFILENVSDEKLHGFSQPGRNRQMSVFNGLKEILKFASEDDFVLIHDAARPLLSAELITECLTAVCGHDGVMPVLPMKDTVYMSNDGNTVSSLLERNKIFAGQAPEVFVLGRYYEANKNLTDEQLLKINGSTEPAIKEGLDVVMIAGDENNFKITTAEDMERFRELCEDR